MVDNDNGVVIANSTTAAISFKALEKPQMCTHPADLAWARKLKVTLEKQKFEISVPIELVGLFVINKAAKDAFPEMQGVVPVGMNRNEIEIYFKVNEKVKKRS